MNLSTKSVGWHLASIAAGAWGAVVFAQSHAVDLYALIGQLKKDWGDLVITWSMLLPFLAAAGAAYRTWNSRQVPKDAVVVDPPPKDAGAGKIAALIAIGLGLMFAAMLYDGVAQAQPKLPQFKSPLIAAPQLPAPAELLADIKAKLGGIPDIQSKLDAIKSSLPAPKTPTQVATDIEQAITAIESVTVKDFQDGITVFDTAKNYAGSNCYKALLDVVQANVIANASIAATDVAQPAPPASDQARPLPVPVQHAFLAIAKLYNIVVANHPGGPVSMQCAAMKQDINASGPMSALLGSSVFSKVLPLLKIIGIAG